MEIKNSPQNEDTNDTKPVKKSVFNSPFFWAAISGVLVVTLMRPFMVREPMPPAVVGELPAYELVNQNGEVFGSAQLKGQVYVANFVFTTCPSVCPLLTKSMADLQKRFQDAKVPVRLVSFSVDPENDTPEKFKAYGEQFGADFARWSFVTVPSSTATQQLASTSAPSADISMIAKNSREKMRALLEDGFKVPFTDPVGERMASSGNLFDIAHTKKFVIVDRSGGIRGYYDTNEEGIDEIFHRSQHVLKEKAVAR